MYDICLKSPQRTFVTSALYTPAHAQNHINYIRNKVAKSLGIITKMRPMLTKEILLNMYYTFVHCYLNSGIVIWGSTHTNKLDSLIKLKKKPLD